MANGDALNVTSTRSNGMPDRIDYQFISELEGGCRTTGYVPAAKGRKSGVTIATGFDLGQRNEGDLRSLGLDARVIAAFRPYLGIKGAEAAALLKKNPLSISSIHARDIDQKVKAEHIRRVRYNYDSAAGNTVKFNDLPPAAQTVIMSVSFQYGPQLMVETPLFWKAVTTQNWVEAIEILNFFKDEHLTRRRREAALLESIQ